MDNNPRSQDWQREFNEFCSSKAAEPPAKVSARIRAQVRYSLALAPWLVFAKLFAVGLVGGAASLLFCPQFGIGHGHELNAISRLYMSFGESGCMAACGGTFLMFSVILTVLTLSHAEIRLIRRTQFLQVPAVSFVFLTLFICSGAEVMFSSGLLWFFGGVIAGLGTLNFGWLVRSRLGTEGFTL